MDNVLFHPDEVLKNHDTGYMNLVLRERRWLYMFIKHEFLSGKFISVTDYVILVYSHTNFGERTFSDYKIVRDDSTEYQELMRTDDWKIVCTLSEALDFYGETINNQ